MTAIGPYELIGKVAQTHHSTIWRAKDPHLNRDVALKQVNRQAGEQTLRREATLLATLDHPNIVRVYDILITDTDAWLIEEWINGATLAAVRDHSGKLTTHQALGITHGALQGLAYAHQRNIIHCDISPTNILITTTGTSQLIDFGSATHTTKDDTAPGEPPHPPTSSGTNHYRSPEVTNGQPPTKTSDVYSTAAVLTDLLTTGTTNTNPGTTDTQNPAPPTTLDPINHVLRKALNPNPNERHPDATALLADLQQATERALGPAWLTLASTSGLATATLTSTTALITNTTITGTATTTAIAGAATAPIAGTPLAAAPLAALGTPTTTEQLHATGQTPEPATTAEAAPTPEPVDIQQVSYTEPNTTTQASTSAANTVATTTKTPTKWLAIIGGAAATIAIIITAVILTRGDSDTANAGAETPAATTPAASSSAGTSPAASPSPSPTPTSSPAPSPTPSPTPSPSPSPTPPAVTPAGFNGNYIVEAVTTAVSGGTLAEVGAAGQATWTVASACTDGSCAASIESSSGFSFTLTPSGGDFVGDFTTTGNYCVDFETGLEVDQPNTVQRSVALTPTIVDGTIVALAGIVTIVQVEPCPKQTEALSSETQKLSITRKGP